MESKYIAYLVLDKQEVMTLASKYLRFQEFTWNIFENARVDILQNVKSVNALDIRIYFPISDIWARSDDTYYKGIPRNDQYWVSNRNVNSLKEREEESMITRQLKRDHRQWNESESRFSIADEFARKRFQKRASGIAQSVRLLSNEIIERWFPCKENLVWKKSRAGSWRKWRKVMLNVI